MIRAPRKSSRGSGGAGTALTPVVQGQGQKAGQQPRSLRSQPETNDTLAQRERPKPDTQTLPGGSPSWGGGLTDPPVVAYN